jgi:hypothetical protein
MSGTARMAALIMMSAAICRADCYSFDKAPQHVGEIVCIRGRVVKVSAGASGTHYLNFCEGYLTCPFTVVVFPAHLEQIGDVRTLENHEIEIDGLVKLYHGHPEIILAELSQLHGDAASHIPPLPKKYDVAEHGKFSAGTTYAKKPKSSKKATTQTDNTDPFSE